MKILIPAQFYEHTQASLSRVRDENDKATAKASQLESENREIRSKNSTLESIIRALSERNAFLSDSLNKAQNGNEASHKQEEENKTKNLQGARENVESEQISRRYDDQVFRFVLFFLSLLIWLAMDIFKRLFPPLLTPPFRSD